MKLFQFTLILSLILGVCSKPKDANDATTGFCFSLTKSMQSGGLSALVGEWRGLASIYSVASDGEITLVASGAGGGTAHNETPSSTEYAERIARLMLHGNSGSLTLVGKRHLGGFRAGEETVIRSIGCRLSVYDRDKQATASVEINEKPIFERSIRYGQENAQCFRWDLEENIISECIR